MEKEIKYYLQQTFALPGTVNEMQDAEIFLTEKINDLIQNNFNHLVQLLYCIDVNETKLKKVLKDNPNEDAAKVIAQLIIERQQQKVLSRNTFRKKEDGMDENERW